MKIASKLLNTIRSIKEGYTSKGGLYSHVPISYEDMVRVRDRLQKFLPEADIDNIHEGHITVIYSKTDTIPFETAMELAQPQPSDYPYECITDKFTIFDTKNDGMVLVLLVASPVLEELNRKWQDAGYVMTYPEYRPHITIEYDTKYTEDDLRDLNHSIVDKPITISFSSEIIEDLRE